MSDSDLTQKTNFTQNQNPGSTQNLKDQVADAGAEIKQRAGDALRASTDVARDKIKEAADAAKDVASGTVDQLQEQTRQQQRTGADFVERFAGNIREAARAFERETPFAFTIQPRTTYGGMFSWATEAFCALFALIVGAG